MKSLGEINRDNGSDGRPFLDAVDGRHKCLDALPGEVECGICGATRPPEGGPVRMAPGQEPYSDGERIVLAGLVRDAAESDPGELAEPLPFHWACQSDLRRVTAERDEAQRHLREARRAAAELRELVTANRGFWVNTIGSSETGRAGRSGARAISYANVLAWMNRLGI